MKRLLLLCIVLFALPAAAQLATMEQIPTIRQANETNAKVFAYGSNVVSGNTLIVAFRISGTCATPTIADTLSTSWGSPVVSITTTNLCFYVWIGSAPSSGADTVTITSTLTSNPQLQGQEWEHLSTTVDATATAGNSFVSFVAAMPNITTTKYRDLILDFVECTNTDVIGPDVGSSYEPIASSNTGTALYSQFLIPTADPGTFSSSVTDVNNRTCAEAVVAVESTTTLTVSTPSIPDAVSGLTYSFQLGATGGTGTNSWAITSGSLPLGLSLSSAGVISGTPTSSSHPSSITFQVTDASSATATASLSLAVGTSASTQSQVNTAHGSNNLALGSVTAGNTIVVVYTNVNNWSSGIITDTVGTLYSPIPSGTLGLALGGISGTCRCNLKAYWGVAAGTGSDTITLNGVTGSPNVGASEFSNTQMVFDTTVASLIYSSSGGTTITSGSITSPVAETLYAASIIGTGSGATLTINSPFTDNGNISSSRIDSGYESGAAAGSNSASWAVTANTSNLWAAMLFGLRPKVSGTAPAQSPQRSQVY